MRLVHLRLANFRNHLNLSVDFTGGTNVLVGDNGQGKTNIVEAISYLCLAKSFYAHSDTSALAFNEAGFSVDGLFVSDRGQERVVRVSYDAARAEKSVLIDRSPVEPLSSLIGQFPVVICSPEHAPITLAGPSERRKFVDFVISQSSPIYFQTLLEYRRVIRHRNKILLDGKLNRRDVSGLLSPWDEQLIGLGSTLVQRRRQFVQEFRGLMTDAYMQLIPSGEEPAIAYTPNCATEDVLKDEHQIGGILRQDLQRRSSEERRLGTTLVGPHRDEFPLTINGQDLRKYASQGQHKTFLVALKLAELSYIRERCGETPVVLLDDVFSELDEHRSRRLLDLIGELGQTVITSTTAQFIDSLLPSDDRTRILTVQQGRVMEQKPVGVQ